MNKEDIITFMDFLEEKYFSIDYISITKTDDGIVWLFDAEVIENNTMDDNKKRILATVRFEEQDIQPEPSNHDD